MDIQHDGTNWTLIHDGRRQSLRVAVASDRVTVRTDATTHVFHRPDPLAPASAAVASGDTIHAPMPGLVREVMVAAGATVEAGQVRHGHGSDEDGAQADQPPHRPHRRPARHSRGPGRRMAPSCCSWSPRMTDRVTIFEVGPRDGPAERGAADPHRRQDPPCRPAVGHRPDPDRGRQLRLAPLGTADGRRRGSHGRDRARSGCRLCRPHPQT